MIFVPEKRNYFVESTYYYVLFFMQFINYFFKTKIV